MQNSLTISGILTKRDLQHFTRKARGQIIGPTTVYYAGVTAPAISAGMTLISRHAFSEAGLPTYWIYLLSAFCAVFAGISWYLIFMRWAAHSDRGRGGEKTVPTEITLTAAHLELRNGPVCTQIQWPAFRTIKQSRKGLLLYPEGAGAIFIPDTWFETAPLNKDAFVDMLERRTGTALI